MENDDDFVHEYADKAPFDLLALAMSFASEGHRFQRRKCLEVDPKTGNKKKPAYIVHPARVMNLLASVDWDKFHRKQTGDVMKHEVMIAALFHDLIEDTHVTYDEIKRLFGKVIADLVQECTFVAGEEGLTKSQVKKQEVTRPATMSDGAILIKLCDMADNLSNLLEDAPRGWTRERIQGYFVWKREVMKATPRVNGDKALIVLLRSLMVDGKFQMDGETHDALPKDKDGEMLPADVYAKLLEAYYEHVDEYQAQQRAYTSACDEFGLPAVPSSSQAPTPIYDRWAFTENMKSAVIPSGYKQSFSQEQIDAGSGVVYVPCKPLENGEGGFELDWSKSHLCSGKNCPVAHNEDAADSTPASSTVLLSSADLERASRRQPVHSCSLSELNQ